jgi:AcrR family transcriptional regulator
MKDEILQTALNQFLKYGIREMSIQNLIAPLGISTKTVYKYFKNKEELLEEVLKLHYVHQYEVLENLSEGQNIATLFFDIWYLAIERDYNVNNLFYRDLHYYYPELEKKMEDVISSKFEMQFKNLIRKGIYDGVFKPDCIPEVVMEGIYILYQAIARTDHFKKFNVSPYEILLNTITLFIKGLCTPKGISDLERHIATVKPFGLSDGISKTNLVLSSVKTDLNL